MTELTEEQLAEIKRLNDESLEKILLDVHRKALSCDNYSDMYKLVCQLKALIEKYYGN